MCGHSSTLNSSRISSLITSEGPLGEWLYNKSSSKLWKGEVNTNLRGFIHSQSGLSGSTARALGFVTKDCACACVCMCVCTRTQACGRAQAAQVWIILRKVFLDLHG